LTVFSHSIKLLGTKSGIEGQTMYVSCLFDSYFPEPIVEAEIVKLQPDKKSTVKIGDPFYIII